MAYNLYQVQMSNAWAQRVAKENAMAERFWLQRALESQKLDADDCTSVASFRTGASRGGASTAITGYSSKTSFLKDKLATLERELTQEREFRRKVESDLQELKSTGRLSRPGSSAGGR